MPSSKNFVQKIMSRLDRIDKSMLKEHLDTIADENDMLWSLLLGAPLGFVLIQKGGKIVWANRQAAELLGIPELRAGEIFDPRKLPDSRAAAFFERAAEKPAESRREDLHLFLPSESFVRVHWTPIPGPSRHEALAMIENRSEEMMDQMEMRMARIESVLKLTAGIAHEIGNPLNSLKIHLELMKKEAGKLDGPEKLKLQGRLEIMRAETARLDRIVRDFLKAARRSPLRFKQEDITRIVEEALDVMKPELTKGRITVALKAAQDIPLFMMDRDRIYQAVLNLIKNAREAMPEGGVLAIQILKKEKLVILKVRDQGVGIAENDLPFIFDAYFTTKKEGAGLGLMAVQQAVQDHAGRIDVASKRGQGSTFTVTLPIRQPKLQLPRIDLGSRRKRS
ncbi:MAG: two-component system sensor histidine kinase NtrB [Candidatus Omnitrophota bacterium]